MNATTWLDRATLDDQAVVDELGWELGLDAELPPDPPADADAVLVDA